MPVPLQQPPYRRNNARKGLTRPARAFVTAVSGIRITGDVWRK